MKTKKVNACRLVSLCACLLALLIAAAPATADQTKKLYLFNWSQYMNPAIIDAFEHKYDVKVVRAFYGSNPEMFAKLRAGGEYQYDVIFPSNYYVPRLIETGLIQPLNKDLIPNYDNLMAKFQDPSYDPGGTYTAAYQWGTTGIAYNTEDLPDVPESWALLFDPEINSRYPFAMITDAQVLFGAACAYQGHGYACLGKKNWKQAAQLILKTKQRPNFAGFVNGTPVLRRLARGSVSVGMTFSGDYLFFKKRNPEAYANIEFFVPKEGSELWVDVMAIPAHAPHPKLANKFINFILNPKIGAKLSNWNAYASPNKAARPYLNEALTKPPILPTDAKMKKLHFTPAIKGEQLQYVQQLWTAVLSR